MTPVVRTAIGFSLAAALTSLSAPGAAGQDAGSSAAPQEYPVPDRVGFVNDFAGILTPSSIEAIEARARETLNQHSGEIVVVTLQNLGGHTSAELATRFVQVWAVGLGRNPNGPDPRGGVLILLSYEDRDMSIQVSGEATTLVTRDVLDQIAREEIAPFLRDNDFSSGLFVGVQAISAMFEARYGLRDAEDSDS